MPKSRDYTDQIGKKYGRLTIKRVFLNGSCYAQAECICDCGKECVKRFKHVENGAISSCGCWHDEAAKINGKTHGLANSLEYRIWGGLKTRCYNKKSISYQFYGAKGITICDRWLNSFENFLEDMGPIPSPKHSLDRYPNQNGHYGPDNCRWADKFQQSRNMKTNVYVEINGQNMIVQDWCTKYSINSASVYYRIGQGETPKQALNHFLYGKKYERIAI